MEKLKQYTEKILQIAYYEIMPNKEAVNNAIKALIEEYTKQEMKKAYDAGRNNPYKEESLSELVYLTKNSPESKNFENWYLNYESIKSI